MSSRSDTLHCVVRAPRDGETLSLALSMLTPGDVLLLMQDGVWAAYSEHIRVPEGVEACVLMGDVLRRGLDPTRIRGFALVDEAGFVALAARTARQVCWA
jgi:tRNA 2-thiouridine synthesizing protein B